MSNGISLPAHLLSQLPEILRKCIMDFQKEGVAFGHRCKGRCMLADEMGLGKTVQAIALAWLYRKEWPLLVICPSSMRFSWLDELEKWLPSLRASEFNLIRHGKDIDMVSTAKVTIVTYGLLIQKELISALAHQKFQVVIADESHYLKNRKAKRTKALVPILKSAKRAILLSGTPALARPEELFSQLNALQPKLWGSFSTFTKRYCNAQFDYRFKRWDTKGASNLPELNNRLKSVMIRRLKSNVLHQLPEKRRQRINLQLPDAQAKALTDKLKEMYNLSKSDYQDMDPWECRGSIFSLCSQLYKETGLAKIALVRRYVSDLIKAGAKCIIFAHHLKVIEEIEGLVASEGVGYIRITGETLASDRHRQVKEFQEKDSVRVAVLSMTAAGQGITLTAASTVVFAELHWTPGVLQQAEDRAHRIGQKNAINVMYLVAKGSLDEMLWNLLMKKVSVLSKALSDGKGANLRAKSVESPENLRSSSSIFKQWMEDKLGDELKDTQDIRSFFNPKGKFYVKKKKSQKSRKRQVEVSQWSCPSCSLSNLHSNQRCTACFTAKPVSLHGTENNAKKDHRKKQRTSATGKSSVHTSKVMGNLNKSRETLGKRDKKADSLNLTLLFSVSKNTGRISVFDIDDQPLNINFTPKDLQDQRKDRIPESLLSQPEKLRQAQRFVRLWSQLRAVDRNMLYNTAHHTPLHRLQRETNKKRLQGKDSVIRFTSKDSYLASSSRLGSKQVTRIGSAGSHIEFQYAQNFTKDGIPICLYCSKAFTKNGGPKPSPVANSVVSATQSKEAKKMPKGLDTRFCSYKCRLDYQTRTNGSAVRRQLFELEHGRCSICKFDAHSFYLRIKVLPVSQRRRLIEQNPYVKGLSTRRKEALVIGPSEGQLWQADHINPVSEGGGECGLDNYRTLCTLCHNKETEKLRQRLKLKGAGAGSSDIRTFFNKKSPKPKIPKLEQRIATRTHMPKVHVTPVNRQIRPNRIVVNLLDD
ncbi:hypothetical protein AAMO2058_000282600 [Amorphochlora amoebiformis]